MPLIKVKQIEGLGSVVETGEIIPLPEGVENTQGTNAVPLAYVGGSYFLRRAADMSRIVWRLTSNTLGSSARFLLYQTSDGGSGIASKIASVTVTPVGPGAQTVTGIFEQSTVRFKEGLVYILYGRPVVTASTMRVYSNNNLDLLTGNMVANTHPVAFTTLSLASAADPATLNPLTVAADTTDLLAIVRLLA